MGTQIGDVYEIDPVAMAVIKRIPALQIGPSGYAAYEVRVMADGKLALLGGQGGIPDVDYYDTFAVWNPTDNSIASFAAGSACEFLGNIAHFTLTADRTKLLFGDAGSSGIGSTICLFDPSTGSQRVVHPPGFINSILTPPDGSAILASYSAFAPTVVTAYDPIGLFQTDQFQLSAGGSGAVNLFLSFDGSTLYVMDWVQGTTTAYDWKTHQQTGWVTNFAINDMPQFVPLLATDPTGLLVGSIGDGVGFLDASALLPAPPPMFPYIGSGVVSPASGPVQGGTSIQIPAPQNLANVYLGSQLALNVAVGATETSAVTPPGSPGPADLAMSTTDGGLMMAPEGFSYGPWIVETITNASTAEGGGTGILWGYGFGPAGEGTTASGLSVSAGGQIAAVTSYSGQVPSEAVPYPFPIESVEFTLPPGTAGSAADVTVTSASGSTTAKGTVQYLPATQQFPLTGASLYQGIYDSTRAVYYFTDQSEIRVFSRTQGAWLAPFSIKGATRLYGLALSPDGSKLAVGDAGNDVIDVLDPDTPTAVSTFTLPNTLFDMSTLPNGVAITDAGIVYYATFQSNGGTGAYSLHKLNTPSGSVTDYQEFDYGGGTDDPYNRILLSSDNSRLYFNLDGIFGAVDTATDTVYENAPFTGGDNELTLSSNQTGMSAEEYLMDTNLNVESGLALNEREAWSQEAVYGEKMSPDGNLLFIPLTNGIYVVDGKRGTVLQNIALPFALSANYDALVSDGQDNVLVAITGQNGNGIAVIDLTSLPEPLPPPYASAATNNLACMSHSNFADVMKKSQVQSAKVKGRNRGRHPQRIPHRTKPFIIQPHIH